MCWIEVPSRAIREEVQARIDSDSRAIMFTEPKRTSTVPRIAVIVAFAVGVVIGWLCHV